MITLDSKYTIDTSGEGSVLIFREKRMKPEIIDKVKTGKEVEYTHKQQYYLLDVGQALNRYLQLNLEDCEDVKGLMIKMEEVESLIKNLKV